MVNYSKDTNKIHWLVQNISKIIRYRFQGCGREVGRLHHRPPLHRVRRGVGEIGAFSPDAGYRNTLKMYIFGVMLKKLTNF